MNNIVEKVPDLTPEGLKTFLEKKRKFLGEVSRQMDEGFLKFGKGLSMDQCHMFIEHQNPFMDIPALLDEWACFYKRLGFGEIDFSDVVVPNRRPGFNRLIVVPQGMTLEMTIELCRASFPCRVYMDEVLDGTRVKNAGESFDSAYALWARNGRGPDPILRDMSAYTCRKSEKTFMKLIPRLIFELKFFHECGRHLDNPSVGKNHTICPDTNHIRPEEKELTYLDGGVPMVSADNCGVYIEWCPTGNHHQIFGPREVIEN